VRRREFVKFAGAAAIAWPLAARAQRQAMPVIGYLSTGSLELASRGMGSLRQGLSETGYVEGQNLTIEYRFAEGSYDRLPALAADLVGRKVDAILAAGTASALAAKAATSTIPIVFEMGADPVELGLVNNFARPENNITGISIFTVELMAKRLDLMCELVPAAKEMALLVNPGNSGAVEHMLREVPEAARARGVQLDFLKAATASEIDTAFASLTQLHAGALLVGAATFFNSRREQFVALAARYAIPAIYNWRSFTSIGGLISYGAQQVDLMRHAGAYVGKILNGTKPTDLPVERPTKFELVINLKTAKALGLTVPQSLLSRADEVIE
jgi:putative tryptophan/tyrosine transport system substrate-binding protein